MCENGEDSAVDIEKSIQNYMSKKLVCGKRVNSIRKGKSFERDCAKLLTEALGIPIVRIPQSGAFSTVHSTPMWAGDLMCSDPGKDVPFVFEAKFYREADLHHIISSKNPKIVEWIRQAVRESSHTGKVPVVLYKYNRSNAVFAVFRRDDLGKHVKMKSKSILFMTEGSAWTVTDFHNIDWKSAYDELTAKTGPAVK